MNSSTCRHARREIDELEIGQQLGGPTLAHLAACPSCTQFRRERADLRELIGGLGPVVAPADFDMRLRARIAREQIAAERQPFFARLIGMPAIAMAAVVVLAVATVVWVGQRNSDQSTTTANPPATSVNQVAKGTAPAAVPAATSDAPGRESVADNGRGFAGRKNRTPGRSGASRDYGVMSASSIKQSDSFVNAPSKPVVVSLKDDRGTTRKISLPAVSFGAQSLVDNRTVSYPGNSRVW
jgi:hypothetical protein